MDAQRWAVIESLYHAALAKEPDERSSYLAAACAEDLRLRIEVESLLGYAEVRLSSPAERAEVAKLWEQIADIPLAETSTTVQAIKKETRLPTTVGRYRILRLLGEGGMGTVYEAEQELPRRTVALKVIRPGLTSTALLRRFEQESQALARLQHPGIAQIYEAGTADTGSGPQPYFAMEFIRGASLLAYAEAHQLNARQRLELMAKVCEAVHHAHQRGIIHRDLKPANILVDESGQPKILDFGVARATDSDAHATRQTELGQIVGTLAYMSPEQVLGDPLDLDTRSDVYALGVILFELLAGRLPYTTSGQVHQAVQTIREEDPARLSSVSRAYRGDIETIVGKALEKDKARRYASAAGMAADIQRYLKNEPITARPPTTAYQLQKFATRHKALVGGMAAVFVVLIAGIIASTWEATRARRAEQTATTEAATAKAVNDFLENDLLAQASANNQTRPDTKADPDLKVRTALDRAAAGVAGKFGKQPLVEASIRQTIGDTYRDLGLYPDAQRQMERAVEIRRRVLGGEHRETLASMQKLAVLYGDEGKYASAELLYTKVLELRTRTLGEDNPDTMDTMDNLASVYSDEGKYPQAEALFTKILGVQRRLLGEKDSNTLDTMGNLAILYFNQGNYERAEPLFTKIFEIRRQTQGEEHPDTLISMNNLAALYKDEAKYGQAEPLDVKVLEVRRRVLGVEHPYTLASMNNLATVYQDEGKYEQAESLNVKVLEVRQRVLGMEHPDTLTSMNNLATVYQNEGKYEQAEPLYTELLELQRRLLGEQHPYTLLSMNNLALLYRHQGKYIQAELLFTKVLEGRRRALGSGHPDTLISTNDLALLYLYRQKYSEAEGLLREVLKTEEQRMSHSWARFNSQSMLGASLAGQKKYAEAEPLLLSGYEGMLQREATIPAASRIKLEQARKWIVQLYQDWGKPEKAAEWRKGSK
jgi:tetratricopeptide (TPR) repeat protein